MGRGLRPRRAAVAAHRLGQEIRHQPRPRSGADHDHHGAAQHAGAHRHLIWGAVFERFPKLRIVSVESGVGWLGYLLERMDHVYRKHCFWTRSALKKPPSEYFYDHVYATFQEDRIGMKIALDVGTHEHDVARISQSDRRALPGLPPRGSRPDRRRECGADPSPPLAGCGYFAARRNFTLCAHPVAFANIIVHF